MDLNISLEVIKVATITAHTFANNCLDKKAVDLVNYCDFEVAMITHNGVKGFILWDTQLAMYRHSDIYESIEDYLANMSVKALKDVHHLIGDPEFGSPFFDDYGIDTKKAYDEDILSAEQCFLEEAV